MLQSLQLALKKITKEAGVDIPSVYILNLLWLSKPVPFFGSGFFLLSIKRTSFSGSYLLSTNLHALETKFEPLKISLLLYVYVIQWYGLFFGAGYAIVWQGKQVENCIICGKVFVYRYWDK